MFVLISEMFMSLLKFLLFVTSHIAQKNCENLDHIAQNMLKNLNQPVYCQTILLHYN